MEIKNIAVFSIIGILFIGTIFFSGCTEEDLDKYFDQFSGVDDDSDSDSSDEEDSEGDDSTEEESEHYECVNERCNLVEGSGSDECSSDSDCEIEEESHYECANGDCKRVSGLGSDECSKNSECRHKECVDEQCKNVYSVGNDDCTDDSDCEPESLCSGTDYSDSDAPSGTWFSGTCDNNCDVKDHFYNSGDDKCYWGYVGHAINGGYGDSCIWDNKEDCDSECTDEGCDSGCDGTEYTDIPSGASISGTCDNNCDAENHFYNSGDEECFWGYVGFYVTSNHGASCLWGHWEPCDHANLCTSFGCIA